MRHLMLLRHAKASWDDPGMADHGRPINPRGRAAATLMRDAMQAMELAVQLVLVSSARRTLQTLQSLAPYVAPQAVEPMDRLYLASAHDMLQILREVTPVMHDVLLIAHNPGLHDLAMLLADRPLAQSTAPGADRLGDAYPTMGLTRFEVPGDWADLQPGQATLRLFLTPGDLTG